jgi:hypothetical protein
MTRTTRHSVLAAAAVFALVAVLALVFWPDGSGGPAVFTASTGTHTVRLSVDGLQRGTNSFGLDITEPEGAPAAVDRVTVEPVMPQMGHALAPIEARTEAPGRFRAENAVLPMSGPWEITVSLHAPSGTEHVVFPLLVK